MDTTLTLNKKEVLHCKRYLERYGKSYYFAAQFFPPKLRDATYVLYAFVRLPDEYVDNQDRSKEKLLAFKKKWMAAYKNRASRDPVLNATSVLFHTYNIPYRYSIDFLNAMLTDTYKKRYKDYRELERYMYGSAAVVGLMMTYIIGFNDRRALKYAEDLGYAMQLTNFLRDIGEDHALRNRIYMPLTERKKFKVPDEHFSKKIIDDAFITYMKFNISRARKLYSSAEKGIRYLSPSGKRAVRTALVLYRQILKKIEKNKYDVFNKRAHTRFIEKIFLTWRALYG